MNMNENKFKHHNTAGCFLVRARTDGWEICLIYRIWPNDHQGWVPPKGHVESGETLEDTAIRETIEETGYINIKIIKPLQTLHIQYPWDDGFIHKKDIHYFLAELVDDEHKELALSDSEKESQTKVEWMSLKDAEKKLLFDDEREILKEVIRTYRQLT